MVLESNTLDVLFVKDGQQGEDGKILYTWIKYAKDANGTGITDDPNGAIYIGISYNNESSIESNDPTHYAWTKIQGVDGKKGEDAYTIFLENENISFATDENRNPLSEQAYTSGITIMKGAKPVTDFTIGDIAKTQGIAVAKTDTAIAISVINGNPLPSDSGVIEIPITLDGQTVKKQFSWSCGKQGPQGVQGNDGNSFAWNMLSETNCGKKHWGTESSGGKYSVEDFITEDNIDAVKLICTEAISTSNWSYVLFKDIKMLKQLKPSTKYTLSYDIKANRSGAISHSICKGDVSNFCTNTIVVNNIIGNETWQHISVVLTTNDLKTTPTNEILYLGRNALSKVGYSIIKNLKLVEGDIDTPWSPSQSDIEGKGVVETVQYYLATSQASGVTSSTSGWSTDITTQKLTADKKYLWNCYQTKYSDGTSEPISTPKVIGVYGDKGANALQCKRNWTGTYTTINGTASAALSDFNRTPVAGDAFTALDGSSNTGTWQVISVSGSNVNIKLLSYVNSKGEKGDNAKNISITPSAQYFKSTDGGKTFAPNQITITPTLQGEISFGKWQYSIDGGVSFADVVSGQKGLTISNNVLSVSKDSSLYSDAVTMVTFRAVANDSSFYDTCSIAKIYDVSDIGDGRNLLWNSNFAKTDEAITGTTNSWGLHTRGTNLVASIDTSTKHNGFNTLKTVSAANGDKNSSNDLEWFAWGISERTSDNLHSKNQNYTLSFYAKASVTTDFIVRWGYDAYGADTTRTLTTNWQKYEIKLHQATSAYSITIIFKLLTAGTVWFSEFKLEKGSSATGYSTAPEDLQTAILSTKSEISDVSLKVDNNRQAIEQRVEKTTYEQDLNLVKGDISKANEGLNKWRYEIYPKSLFTSEYQGKSTMDVFAKNTNLTPSQSVLINDMDLSIAWNYDNNYIGYALTFAKFSAAKSVAITFAHDDGAHIYLNGKLIGGSDAYSQTGESLTLGFVKGWNCIEVVVNEGASTEGFKLGTTISAISECQLMNCYYGTPVARQSHITNQLVQNTTDIDGVSGSVQKVMSTVGGSGKVDEFVNNYSTWKKKVDGIETRVGETYTTKDDFNGLEIGGRNLVRLGGLSGNGATSFSYDKTTDTYTIVSPVVSTVWGTGAAVKYDDNHKVLIPYGKTYILSFEVKVPQALSINIDINNYTVSGSSWAGNDNDDGSTRGQSSYSIPANTWTKVWVRWANTNTKNTNKVDLYDNSSIGLVTKDCTSAVTWQIRHVKGELGNKPTDWTPAPEDVNGKIVNVETIANQTAKKFEWIVKGGDNSSNFTLTDRVADLVAERINFKGLVTFSGLNTDLQNTINNKTNVSYLNFSSGGNTKGFFKIATLQVKQNYANQNIIFGVNHREHGYTECRIRFSNAGNTDPGMGSFKQTGTPARAWRIIKTATSTWDLYLAKADVWDGGRVTKFDNPYGENMLITWSGASADLPEGALVAEQMIADQTTIDGGIITTGYLSADRIAAGSITADKIDVNSIFAKDITATGTITGVTLKGAKGEFSGEITAKDGTIGCLSVNNDSLVAKGIDINGDTSIMSIEKGCINFVDSNTTWRDKSYLSTGGLRVYQSATNSHTSYGSDGIFVQHDDKDSVVCGYYIYSSGEIQTSNCQMRITNGNTGIGCMLRNDNESFYILRTESGQPYGDWTSARPMRIQWSTSNVWFENNLYAGNDLIAGSWIYAGSGGHYTWNGRTDAYIGCGNYNNTNNIYYYAGYHAFYVNGDSGSGMMYIDTSGVSSRKGFRNSSDERIKQNFSHFDDNFIDTYMSLEPVQYQFKNDTDDKYHFGFKAQQTERILNAYGQESDKSYGICATHAIDSEKAEKLYGVKDMHEEYTLAYDELIAPTTYMVQHIYKELESTKEELIKVKQEKADLEARLQAIEAKLGL